MRRGSGVRGSGVDTENTETQRCTEVCDSVFVYGAILPRLAVQAFCRVIRMLETLAKDRCGGEIV